MDGRLRGLRPAGLRWRLAGWFTLLALLCTGIAFVAVYRGTGTQLRQQIDREIAGDASELAHNVALARGHGARQISSAATSYIKDQPFSASSTLLFALVPSQPPSTNRPELLSPAAPDNGESPAEQAEENRLSRHLLSSPEGYTTVMLPDVGDLRLLKRHVRVAGGLEVTIGVGEPLAAVAHAQAGVARTFILAGALALVCALLASYFLGARLSRPLRRMAAVAARVDTGDLHPRIHQRGGESDELKVLGDAFDHMLDRLTAELTGQRAFVADASHELRTPLTVIRGQLEVLAAQPEPTSEEVHRVERLVQAEIARMSRLVDDLLLLAKTEQIESLRTEWIDLESYVSELWDGMSLVANRRFELGTIPQGTLRADPDRLAQALRNLLGNAIDHTAADFGLVKMQVEALSAGRLRFTVDDDGPGIPRTQRELVFNRFHRTDAARDRASGGTGLGLAIVRAIADAHGGVVSAGESPEQGARIVLELPDFRAAARPRSSPAPLYAGTGT